MSRALHFDEWMMGLLASRQIEPGYPPRKAPLSGMLLIEGPTSSGKTTLVKEWVASLAERNALAPEPERIDFYPATTPRLTTWTCTFTARRSETPAQVARRLIDEREGSPQARSTSGLWQEAASYLRAFDVLIVDQAERLSLVACQCINDYLFETAVCSILLVASEAFSSLILRQDPALAQRISQHRVITDFDQPLP